jgi:hypothetical protein
MIFIQASLLRLSSSPVPVASSRYAGWQGSDIVGIAGGAVAGITGNQRLEGYGPFVPPGAAETAGCHLEIAAVDSYCFPVKDGISDFLPGRFEYPLKGGSGDTHFFGALFLSQPFQVPETHRLGFLDGDDDILE